MAPRRFPPLASLTVALVAGGCSSGATSAALSDFPDRELILEVGDGGALEAILAYDAGPTCFALSSASTFIDGLQAQTDSLGQSYMDFNGDEACLPPQFEIPAPHPGDPESSVSVSDGSSTASATFEAFETQRTAVLAQTGPLVPGETVSFTLSPPTDVLDPSQTAAVYFPDDGSGPFLLASLSGLVLHPGSLAFALPTGLPPGTGTLVLGLVGTALPTQCQGAERCTALINATPAIAVTIGAAGP
jgi:hypothetical protein